ncbi:MAG: MarR family winged helix-turn-helix transcriptional regulator [Halodesulfovibrio sp.]
MMHHRTPEGDEYTRLLLATFRLNGRLIAAGDELTREHGLSSALWQVMGALKNDPLPVPRIADTMGLTRQSVQRSVNILFERGLVSFAANPAHKKAKLVMLTAKGRETLNTIHQKQVLWANDIARGLDPIALHKAANLLESLVERLEHSGT